MNRLVYFNKFDLKVNFYLSINLLLLRIILLISQMIKLNLKIFNKLSS